MLNRSRIPFYRYLSWLACFALVIVAGDTYLHRTSEHAALPPPRPPGTTDCGTHPMYAPGSGLRPLPTSTSSPDLPVPDPAATTLLQQALTTTQALTHYEYSYTVESTNPGIRPANLSGAVVTEDTGYVQGHVGKDPVEVVVLHETALRKQAGRWQSQRIHTGYYGVSQLEYMFPDLIEGLPYTSYMSRLPSNIRPLTAVYSYVGAACGVQMVGVETRNGHSVQHLTFQIDPLAAGSPYYGDMIQWPPPTGLPPTMGTGDAWVDPVSKYIHQLRLTVDISPLRPVSYAAEPSASPTTTAPSIQPETTYDIWITRHNDATLQMPPVDLTRAYSLPAEIQLALITMVALQSYHYEIETKFETGSGSLSVGGDMAVQTYPSMGYLKIAGDVVVRQGGYARAESNDHQQRWEELIRGDEVYTKTVSGGAWVQVPALVRQPQRVTTALDLAELIQAQLAAGISFAPSRESYILNGVPVEDYSFQISNYRRRTDGTLAVLAGTPEGQPIGEGTVTLDVQTHYIHQIRMNVTLTAGEGTPGLPGIWLPPTLKEVTITFSQHNDPGITLPTP